MILALPVRLMSGFCAPATDRYFWDILMYVLLLLSGYESLFMIVIWYEN